MRKHLRSIHIGTLPHVRHLTGSQWLRSANKGSTRQNQNVASQAYAEVAALQGTPLEHVKQPGSRNNDIRSYLRQWSPPVDNNPSDASSSNPASSRSHLFPRPRSNPEHGLDLNSILDAGSTDLGDNIGGLGQDEPIEGGSDLSDFIHYTYSLEPGDLICLGQELAVFIRREDHHHMFLILDGRCVVPGNRLHTSYTIKSFASADRVAALSAALSHDPTLVTYTPSNSTEAKAPPVELTGPILSKMQQFQQDMDEFNRANPTAMDDVYKDALPDAFHTLTFEHFVRICMPEQQPLSEAAKLAMLMNFEADVRFVTHSSLYLTFIALLPLDLWKACNRVTQWSRAYQDAAAQAASGSDVSDQLRSNPLTSFIEKGRRLILQSRRYRSPTSLATLGPSNFTLPPDAASSSNQIINDEFSADDEDVISFLWVLYCMIPSFAGKLIGQYRSVGSLILRALGAYPKMLLDFKIGRLALQEMGCLTPWQDFSIFHVFAPLASLGFDPVAKRHGREIRAVQDYHKSNPGVQILCEDSLHHVRKDWGDLPVYTIDNPNVISKDDGISLERASSKPGSYWVRMHVADVAARLPQDHPLIQKALWMGTPYFGKQFTEHLMDQHLIGNHGVRSGGLVLTISTLVDSDGNIQDIEVTPGKVNNVIDIDRSILSRTINQFDSGERVVLDLMKQKDRLPNASCGLDPDHRNRRAQAVHKNMPLFIKLSEILDKRAAARDADLPTCSRTRKEFYYGTHVDVGTIKVPPHYTNIYRSLHYRQDPSIALYALKTPVKDPLLIGGSLARGLVGDCAMLAEESAGKWLFDRHIPAIYGGNKFVPGQPAEKLIQEELERRQNPDAEPSEPDIGRPIYALSTEPSVNLSTSTRYCSPITNPLRSSIDLAMHYQINAYFRTSNDVSQSDNRDCSMLEGLPYSKRDLRDLLSRIAHPGLASKMSSEATTHWYYQTFYRAFHFNEAELPATWNVIVMRGLSDQLKGKLIPFGLDVRFLDSEEKFEAIAEAGSFLPCKIQEVDTVRKIVHMMATGPATSEPEVEINLPTVANDENLGFYNGDRKSS